MEDDIARSVPAVTPMSPLGLDLVMQISTGARTNSTRRWGSIRGDTPRSTPRSALLSASVALGKKVFPSRVSTQSGNTRGCDL